MSNFDGFLFIGHGTGNDGSYDSGACGNGYQEHLVAEQIVNKTNVILRNTYGLNFHIDEQNFKDVDVKGNTYKYNFGITVHLNAGGGRRSEAYVPLGEKDIQMEQYILSDLQNVGITNGGVRSREYNSGDTYTRVNGQAMSGLNYYKEIRDAWELGVSLTILEVGFIDSDDLYVILDNIDTIARNLAQRMAEQCKVTAISKPSNPTPVAPTKPVAPSRPQGAKQYLFLKAHMTSWNVYPTNVAPVRGNQCGVLNPSLFGGLEYEILGNPQKDVYTIQTQNFGKVNIYVPKDADSDFYTKGNSTPAPTPVAPQPQPSNKKYLNLNANVPSWRVYPTNVVPKVGNECGKLAPSQFGGLSYEILGNPQKDVYTISTQSFGKVNIYAPSDADSSITPSPKY